MKAGKKNRSKDTMTKHCHHCGITRMIAYWDYELEYYIYLSDNEATCQNCEKNKIQINEYEMVSIN